MKSHPISSAKASVSMCVCQTANTKSGLKRNYGPMITTQELRIWDGKDSSVSSNSAMVSHVPSPKIIWTLRLLCAVALGVSGYLAYTGLTGSKIAGCGGGVWDCDHVTKSRWGTWFGIPVGLTACGMYAVCLAGLSFANSQVTSLRKTAWAVMTAGGIAAGLAAVWFISLQVLVIGHLCKWCLVAHGCGLCISGLILWHRPAERYTTRLAILSVLGVSVLVGGQLIYKPEPQFEVQEFPVEPAGGVVAPPGVEDGNDAIFAPPGIDMEGDSDTEWAPPVIEEVAPPVIDEFAPPIIEDDSPSEPTASL